MSIDDVNRSFRVEEKEVTFDDGYKTTRTFYIFEKDLLERINDMTSSPFDLVGYNALEKMRKEDKEVTLDDEEIFQDVIKQICNYVKISSSGNDSNLEKYGIKVNRDDFVKFIEKYKDIYDHLDSNSVIFTKEDNDELCNFFKDAIEICEKEKESYFKRDLIIEYNNIIEDVKDLCSEDEYNYYAMFLGNSHFNMEDMKRVLSLVHEKLKQTWVDGITDVDDYEVGSKFSFLAHSVVSENWNKKDGDFRTPYVSTSLLTDKLWDRVNRPYGFILDSKDIVAASSFDLYTLNGHSGSSLFLNTSVNPISSKEKVERECILQKQENIKNDNNKKVYSEIVVEGFHPKAIFCQTDGSKLDRAYNGALELQRTFPDLKIVELDRTFYVDNEKRNEIFNKMLENLSEITHIAISKTSDYEPMFIDFMLAKKEKKYNPSDLIDTYKNISLDREIINKGRNNIC